MRGARASQRGGNCARCAHSPRDGKAPAARAAAAARRGAQGACRATGCQPIPRHARSSSLP
jgi:hypothetical protein